jgi:hypothetical protein
MTKEFFGKQMDRLRTVYSAAALNPERIEILWARYKHIPEAQFSGAVTFLIGEFTGLSLPAISKFDDAIARFRPREAPKIDEITSNFRCEPCRDFGYGWIGDTIVRCVCPLGEKVTDADIARHQKSYDKGRRFLKTPADLARLMKGGVA